VSDIEDELHDLMMRGLAGDAAAHQRLLETLGQRFRVFFRSRMRVGDPSYIEDLVQETLIAIHTRRESYNPQQPVRAWVYAIARYKLIDHFRRTKTMGVSVPVDEVDNLFSNEEADASDPARDVAALLDQLPPKQRMAIQLVKLQELSVREAAARTGMSESDVKISIHRGMKKLSALVAKGAQQ
jgi:RNA polymerase sigma-70 factor (ECF subfamily)